MENPVMSAFWKGFAELVTAFFDKARKQGFSIMLLIVVSGGLLYKTIDIERGCAYNLRELREQSERDKKQYSEALNLARKDFWECDMKRQELAIKLVELTVRVQMLEKKKR